MAKPPAGSLEPRIPWPLASRLDLLIAVQRDPANNAPFTRERISQLVWQRCRVHISPSHISHLVRGRARSITAVHLWALATVFGVPMSYFTDDETAAVSDVVLRASLEDEAVRSIALKLVHSTPEQRRIVDQVVNGLLSAASNTAGQTPTKPPEDKEAPAAGETDSGR